MCRPVIDFTVIIVHRDTFEHSDTRSFRNSFQFVLFMLLKYKVSDTSAVVKTGVEGSVALLMGERILLISVFGKEIFCNTVFMSTELPTLFFIVRNLFYQCLSAFGISTASKNVNYLFNPLNTYLLTYLFTPLSRVLLEKLTGFQLVKKFSAFYETRRFITAFTNSCHLSLS
jgi:hypothetical protein